MKITRLKIEGREYLLCCPIYVMKEMNEHFGGMEKIDEALSQNDLSAVIDESLWILSTLMKAGERYAEKNDLDHNKALSVEQLQDLCDISTLFDIRESIFDVLSASAKQEVELEPAKNQDTTSGE